MFIQQTYENTSFKPDHIFFDNNCRLKLHVQSTGNPWWDGVGLTVDVFHFKSKHRETDLFCQTYCNPAGYPELIREDGGWFFNSSIAEQTNVWLANYHSMCREMNVDRFNFFLDEMIMRRNRITITKLERQGELPGNWQM